MSFVVEIPVTKLPSCIPSGGNPYPAAGCGCGDNNVPGRAWAFPLKFWLNIRNQYGICRHQEVVITFWVEAGGGASGWQANSGFAGWSNVVTPYTYIDSQCDVHFVSASSIDKIRVSVKDSVFNLSSGVVEYIGLSSDYLSNAYSATCYCGNMVGPDGAYGVNQPTGGSTLPTHCGGGASSSSSAVSSSSHAARNPLPASTCGPCVEWGETDKVDITTRAFDETMEYKNGKLIFRTNRLVESEAVSELPATTVDVGGDGFVSCIWREQNALGGAVSVGRDIRVWRYIGGGVAETYDCPYPADWFDAIKHKGRVVVVVFHSGLRTGSSSSSSAGHFGAWYVGVGTQVPGGTFTWSPLKPLNFPAGAGRPRCGAFRLNARKDEVIEMSYMQDAAPCSLQIILSGSIDSQAENVWY